MLTGPRIYFAMARDGFLHASIHKVHGRFQTPLNAIFIQAVWSTLLLVAFYCWKDNPKDAFDGLTDSVIFAGMIFYGLSVASVYVLRRTRPDQPRPYRTWGYPVTPALLLIAYAAVAVHELIDRPTETKFVGGLIAAGVVYYMIVRRREKKRLANHS
jgi:APA family basic amino acid/polyamine antiporter